MRNRATYDLRTELALDSYADLLTSLFPLAATFGLIIRSSAVRLTDHAVSVLGSLEPMLLSAHKTSKWPGTELMFDRMSMVYTYRLNPVSLQILIDSAESLYDWVNPELPEDLHLMRSDGSTVLASIAQEQDAWMELNSAELEQWRQGSPVRLRDGICESR